ncbi:MAG: MOSC N-terminal beta barrel domain-containing protein [Burkholderiales bacterium]|nr:MOSC N-terminal beta barrel domain-containing protein [Burkholderiales bacterium]
MSQAPDVTARLARLFVYPVKSCAGVELREAQLTETGLDLDRAWMVVDERGEFVTQRELPRMALVKPQLKLHEVVLRAPGMLALHLAIDTVEEPVKVRLWDEEVPAYDMGDIAAQWFTDFLGRRLRLVRFDPEVRRLSNAKWTGGVEALNQFSDGYPLLVLSAASLEGLNEKLRSAGQAPVGIERFRPNLVLEGLEAHDEDSLGLIRIATDDGEVQLRPVKPCPRCPIPNIDPATAESNPVVSDTLQGYRRDERVGGAVSFGMNAIVVQGFDATLRVGQAATGEFRFE